MTEDEIKRGRYLGDGVYASFDGYQIWLATNNHSNKVVALDDDVFSALLTYKSDLVKHYEPLRKQRAEEFNDKS